VVGHSSRSAEIHRRRVDADIYRHRIDPNIYRGRVDPDIAGARSERGPPRGFLRRPMNNPCFRSSVRTTFREMPSNAAVRTWFSPANLNASAMI
jgi:hypothetical protein